ncbi:MAG: type IV pilus modification PilV family protein [Opitutaceae bacterium]
MKRHREDSVAGFTLVEVMTAMTVLILVLVSCIAAITIGFRLLEDARLNTLASQVLQSEMENLRLKNWAQISSLPASEPFAPETTLNAGSFQKFSCMRTITDVRTDMKQVELTLTWTSMQGRSTTRTYATYVARGGLNDYYYRKF